MGAIKHLINFIIFGVTVVTLVGMGFLTKAVLGITTNVSCYPAPTVAPTVAPVLAPIVTPVAAVAPKAPFNDVRSYTTIDLNQEQLILAKLSVVCFWILIFIGFMKLFI
jgi:hypothetical protein